jgi:hypothetical protein
MDDWGNWRGVAINRREQQDGDGEEKAEPRQAAAPSAARKVSAIA